MADRTEPPLKRAVRHARIGMYRLLLSQRAIYRTLSASISPNLLRATEGDPVQAESAAQLGISAAVVAYFADSPGRTYQIRQWLPVFERLRERHDVLLVVRSVNSFNLLAEETTLPLVFARRLRDLEDVLITTDPKVCLYVNNSTHNFQPLSWRRALHVHLNHGESDKVSMASNQVKAYDVVFVAGEAAEQRYLENLIAFDGERLVRVGRPQLDLELPSVLESASRPTLMYAPTWEGDTRAMDYTSLPKYGAALVKDLLADGGFSIVYKPHPRVEEGSPAVTSAHKWIVKALASANASLPSSDRHVVEIEGDILPLFGACDVLVCDVSSVALDWLYLRTDAPLWLCDPYDDRDRLVRASPLADKTGVIDGSVGEDLVSVLRASIGDEAQLAAREEARRFYFGELAPGESTRRFLEALDEVIVRRDALVEEKQGARGIELGAGVA
jgi:hypothetical protein